MALLIETIPFVAEEPDFALKGGTAINLFHRDMPRLSVDIDLTYLPVAPRPESLAAIDATIKRMAAAIRKGLPGARVEARTREDPNATASFREACCTCLQALSQWDRWSSQERTNRHGTGCLSSKLSRRFSFSIA
ncbi:nucleotidyl transferase AbiEii/AbiGii toxin family protein [Bradyrhizobium sp. Arg237L]|uniref:nucleotidyl transferase AbiEii/AbiGii toxin family protein n=1 Tax=Bradyrhizobium sp. Arg237L TaxID=3003352 RepID=UPI0032B74CED